MQEDDQQRIFDEWLHQHKGILFKIIRAYAFNDHDRDDLFQEVVLQLWKSIPDFRGESKASTWIYRVALYTALTWTRQEKKQPATQPLDAVPQSDIDRTLASAMEPIDERLDWLYAQIAQLEPLDRSICLLMFEGFRYKEMAQMLGISESNIGVKIHRIKQRLQSALKNMEAEVGHVG